MSSVAATSNGPTAPASASSSSSSSTSLQKLRVKRTHEEWQQLKLSSLAYAAAHGISMVSNPATNTLIHAPLTLLPTVLPRSCFDFVTSLSSDWNLLIDRISRDREFLLTHLAESAKVDEWLRKLIQIYQRVHEEGKEYRQKVRLGIYRSDYMIHVEENTNAAAEAICTAQQIEMNTIAASFAGLSTRISTMHAYMLERELNWTKDKVHKYKPENHAIMNIAKAFQVAVEEYRKQFGGTSHAVVIVVQPGESNAIDQRILEYILWDEYRIPVLRRTLLELATKSTSDDRHQLIIDGQVAAVVYFRAGYTPRDYPSQHEFDAIYLLECSAAIKCPSLGTHLAGTKKIQQVLAQPGMVERFLENDTRAQRLRQCFAGLYALEHDDEATLAIIQEAISNPHSFVLKPQREGGGNNLWADEMVAALKRMKKEERAAFILMKRIEPKSAESALLKNGEVVVTECISELGIYSACVSDATTFHHSSYCGHLLRTKAVGVDEGGVAAGYSCLSSVVFDQ